MEVEVASGLQYGFASVPTSASASGSIVDSEAEPEAEHPSGVPAVSTVEPKI